MVAQSAQKRCAIKVCGITNEVAAQMAASHSITHLGFVFAKSKRQVDPHTAKTIGEKIPQGIKRVGVFVDHSLGELIRIGQEANLSVFQLHGEESPEMCRILKEMTGKEVWKAWRVRHTAEDQAIQRYRGAVDAVLLDSYRAGQHGGTGHSFQWDCIPQFREWLGDLPLFIAGGLHAENVSQLITRYQPDGVDVSSGVERDGQKDPELIERFVRKVRERE